MIKLLIGLCMSLILFSGLFSEVHAQTPDNKLSLSLQKLLQDKKENEKIIIGKWLFRRLMAQRLVSGAVW